VGGELGYLAAALLQREVPVTVFDPFWGFIGKKNNVQLDALQNSIGFLRFAAVKVMFDEVFVADNQEFVDGASAIVSMYGDEVLAPCLEFAAATGKPCAVMPCNECVRFWPPHNRNYNGYAMSLLDDANQKGGRVQRATLYGAPFSWVLLVQLPNSEEGLQMQEQLRHHMRELQQQCEQNMQQQRRQQQQWQMWQQRQQKQQKQQQPQQQLQDCPRIVDTPQTKHQAPTKSEKQRQRRGR